MKLFFRWLIFGTFILMSSIPMLACPNCKDAYTPGSTGASVGESYSISVLFMLGMQLLAIGLVIGRIYFSIRKKQKNRVLA